MKVHFASLLSIVLHSRMDYFTEYDHLLADRTACSEISYGHQSVACMSVCLCFVAKWYILWQKYLNKWIGSARTWRYNFQPPTLTLSLHTSHRQNFQHSTKNNAYLTCTLCWRDACANHVILFMYYFSPSEFHTYYDWLSQQQLAGLLVSTCTQFYGPRPNRLTRSHSGENFQLNKEQKLRWQCWWSQIENWENIWTNSRKKVLILWTVTPLTLVQY